MKLKFLGHSSFKLITNENRIIYIDPYSGEYDEGANLILVSNGNYDHCSRTIIKQIRHDNTEVITSNENSGAINAERLGYNEEKLIDEHIQVKALRAQSEQYPNAISFLIKVDGVILYFAGATKKLENVDCDIAIIPVGGTYTLTPEEASEDIRKVKPKVVIPMHYGSVEGTIENAEHFYELLSDAHIKVMVMNEDEEVNF